jgi:hypothetical protein
MSFDVRAMHARISIRKTRPQGPPPSPDEIDTWLETYPEGRGRITAGTLIDAFDVGDEVGSRFLFFFFFPLFAVRNDSSSRPHHQMFEIAVVKCVGFDADVARKIQGHYAPTNSPPARDPSSRQTWEEAVVHN